MGRDKELESTVQRSEEMQIRLIAKWLGECVLAQQYKEDYLRVKSENKQLREGIKKVLSREFVSDFGWLNKTPLAQYNSPIRMLNDFCECARKGLERYARKGLERGGD